MAEDNGNSSSEGKGGEGGADPSTSEITDKLENVNIGSILLRSYSIITNILKSVCPSAMFRGKRDFLGPYLR